MEEHDEKHGQPHELATVARDVVEFDGWRERVFLPGDAVVPCGYRVVDFFCHISLLF